jgi:hypothetical protein
MAISTVYSQSRDASDLVIRGGNALQFTNNNQQFSLTDGTAPTSVTVPTVGNANSYIAEINVGALGANGTVLVLPAATPTVAVPTGTVTTQPAIVLPIGGIKRVVTPGQVMQFVYTSGNTDTVMVSVSYYSNSAAQGMGGVNG